MQAIEQSLIQLREPLDVGIINPGKILRPTSQERMA